MKLRSKFVASIILVTVVMSGISMYVVRSYIREAALNRARLMTADFVRTKAQERLTVLNFTDDDFHQQKGAFQEFMDQIRSRDILKIKVMNSRFDIVYSTNEHDIGKKTDSVNYRNALSNGAVVAVIKPPVTEAANADMREYSQLMEIYVPIQYEGTAAGVIEAYFRMDAINSEVLEISRYVMGLIIALSLAIIAAGYALLTFQVVRPLQAITAAVEAILAGRPGSGVPKPRTKDEIAGLAALLRKALDKGSEAKKTFDVTP